MRIRRKSVFGRVYTRCTAVIERDTRQRFLREHDNLKK